MLYSRRSTVMLIFSVDLISLMTKFKVVSLSFGSYLMEQIKRLGGSPPMIYLKRILFIIALLTIILKSYYIRNLL